MRKKVVLIWKIVIIFLIVIWTAMVIIDYFNAKREKEIIFCIKKETINYKDGYTNICTGLGYKVIDYNRESINAIVFGPFYINEKSAN